MSPLPVSTLQLRGVCKRYGSVNVINDLSLRISNACHVFENTGRARVRKAHQPELVAA